MPPRGYKLSAESRKRISEARKKSKRCREASRQNAIKARNSITNISRKKQARQLKGRKYSAEHRFAIGRGLKKYCKTHHAEKSAARKRGWQKNSEKQRKACRKNIKKAYSTPKTAKQIAQITKLAYKYGHLGRAAARHKPSKAQLKFALLMRRRIVGLKFDNYPILANGHRYCPDVVNPRTRRCIEIDGSYWHSLPNVKKLDRIRDANLKSVGWKVMRLSAESPSLFKSSTLKRAVSFLKAG
jgi:very-short-patch-repair endonuclease